MRRFIGSFFNKKIYRTRYEQQNLLSGVVMVQKAIFVLISKSLANALYIFYIKMSHEISYFNTILAKFSNHALFSQKILVQHTHN